MSTSAEHGTSSVVGEHVLEVAAAAACHGIQTLPWREQHRLEAGVILRILFPRWTIEAINSRNIYLRQAHFLKVGAVQFVVLLELKEVWVLWPRCTALLWHSLHIHSVHVVGHALEARPSVCKVVRDVGAGGEIHAFDLRVVLCFVDRLTNIIGIIEFRRKVDFHGLDRYLVLQNVIISNNILNQFMMEKSLSTVTFVIPVLQQFGI